MKKYITITISILLLITITTPFTVNAKTAKETLLENVVTTKDGLYKDEYEEGRYIYKGENPNNYITFNNEYAGWRILSVEKDGTIKIIKANSIGKMLFNEPQVNRGTYCEKWLATGCNAWAKMDEFSSENTSGTVTKDSDINTYLNTTYYDQLMQNAKDIILKYKYNIGGTTTQFTINKPNQITQDEKRYTWEGKVGLINISDFIKTMLTNKKTWISEGYSITPNQYFGSETTAVNLTTFSEYDDGEIQLVYTDELHDIYPVVNLDPYITLLGKGTTDNPYTITSPIKIKLETFGDLEKALTFRLETTGKTLSEIKEEIDNQIGTKIEKDGECCTLDSWYLDKDLKNRFDEDTQINNNLTLFGRWECRETETVNVPDTLLQIPNWIINLGCSITIIGILLIVFIIRKKNTRNEE